MARLGVLLTRALVATDTQSLVHFGQAGLFLNAEEVAATYSQVPENEWLRYHAGLWVPSAQAWLPAGRAVVKYGYAQRINLQPGA